MSQDGTIELLPLPTTAVLPLRRKVLRPHQPPEACLYDGDEEEDSLHLGAFLGGKLVAIGSIYRQPQEGQKSPKAWRVRGMAVDPNARGLGLGGDVLLGLMAHAERHEAKEIWLNGRENVKGFYDHFGFQQQGETFDLPDIGPHVLMTFEVKDEAPE